MKTTAIALSVLLGLGCFYSCEETSASTSEKKEKTGKKHADKEKKKRAREGAANEVTSANAEVTVLKSWSMPASLKEISGIALDGQTRFACVQDEEGKIFIFNTATNTVEKEVSFGAPGDYEGIALVGTTAWVLRADGLLFEVQSYSAGKPIVTEHRTPLTVQHDVEGITADPSNNRLLLSVKEKDPTSSAYKGVYAFDLSTKKLGMVPVIKINVPAYSGSKKDKGIKPSEIEVHPTTGDLYVLDGPGSMLLIIGKDGAEKAMYALGTADFPQPEGMAISKGGDIYISNEGKTGQGNILKVAVGI